MKERCYCCCCEDYSMEMDLGLSPDVIKEA